MKQIWEEWNTASASYKAAGTDNSVIKYHKENIHTNVYFKLANNVGIINYNGIIFICDQKSNTLKLGKCSNLKQCIRISLTDGGSLIVNRDNIDELISAISMFSLEDAERILRIIQNERMMQKALVEIGQETIFELLWDLNTIYAEKNM